MVCPFCRNRTEVINSRSQKRTNGVWRRRHCYGCDRIFTSIEKVDLLSSISVKKRSGALEPLSEAKLMISLYKALEHHKNAPEVAQELSQTVINAVIRFTSLPILPSTAIGAESTKLLKGFDAAAAIRYQSFQTTLSSKRDIRKALR